MSESKYGDNLYDMYKYFGSKYVQNVLSNREVTELIKEDPRIVSLLNKDYMTIQTIKSYIDLNIDTFFQLYNDVDLDFMEWILNHESIHDGIAFTVMNVIRDYKNQHAVFKFIMKHIDQLKELCSFQLYSYFRTSNYLEYLSKEEIKSVIKHGYLSSIAFYNDYDDELIPEEKLNGISKATLNYINEDINFYYEIYELSKSSTSDSDLIYAMSDLPFREKFDYDKVVELYKKYDDTALICLCIKNNWLKIFNDTDADYLNFSYYIMKNKQGLNFNLIDDFNGIEFAKKAIKYIEFCKYKDLKDFISYPRFIKLSYDEYKFKKEDQKKVKW